MKKLQPLTPGKILLEEFLKTMKINPYRLTEEIDIFAQCIKMRKIIFISLFFVLSFALNGCHNSNLLPADLEAEILALPDKEAHELFTQAVAKQKRLLPKKVNSYISWIDIVIEAKQISNVYVVDEEKLTIPLSVALTELKKKGKTRILNHIKSNPVIILMAKRGYRINYLYVDKDKNLLHQFAINQNDLI